MFAFSRLVLVAAFGLASNFLYPLSDGRFHGAKLVRLSTGDVIRVSTTELEKPLQVERHKQFKDVLSPAEHSESAGSITSIQKNYRVILDEGYRWPRGEVPYVYKGISPAMINILERYVFPLFHKYTCVKFFHKRETDPNWIEFIDGDECMSKLGMRGGAQPVMLASRKPWRRGSCERKRLAIHELMHALGFEHEHQRTDRDDMLKIYDDYIKDNMKDNFVLFDGKQDIKDLTGHNDSYCFGSIMQYRLGAFAKWKGWKPMALKPAGKAQLKYERVKVNSIGNRNTWAKCDIIRINQAYKCKGKRSTLEQTRLSCWYLAKEMKKGKIVQSSALKPLPMQDGEEKPSGHFWRKCQVDDANHDWTLVLTGCASANGTRIDWGNTYLDRNNETISCLKDKGMIRMSGKPRNGKPVTRCRFPDGNEAALWQKWTEEDLWFECQKLPGNFWGVVVIGCLVNGQTVKLDEPWDENARDSEDSNSYFLTWKCQADAEGQIRPMAVGCKYGDIAIEPGCYKRLIGPSLGWVICRKGPTGEVWDVLPTQDDPAYGDGEEYEC